MYFPSRILFSLLILGSPGNLSPVQQVSLSLNFNSDVGTTQDHHLTKDIEYGYKGPGVYHLTSSNDHYNLALGNSGIGNGDPVVVWYVFYPSINQFNVPMMKWRKPNNTDSQRWFLSDVGSGYVTVANNGTGELLSVNSGNYSCIKTAALSTALSSHGWHISNSTELQPKHQPSHFFHHQGS